MVRNLTEGTAWKQIVALAIPLLLCYNGRRSPGNAAAKWAFYIFYPAHLALLHAL